MGTHVHVVVRHIVENLGQLGLDGYDIGALACVSRDTAVDWEDVKRSYARARACTCPQGHLPRRHARILAQFSLTRDEAPGSEWNARDPFLKRVVGVALLKHGGPVGLCRAVGSRAEELRLTVSIARFVPRKELDGALGRAIRSLPAVHARYAKYVMRRARELLEEYRSLEYSIEAGDMRAPTKRHAFRYLRTAWIPGTRYAQVCHVATRDARAEAKRLDAAALEAARFKAEHDAWQRRISAEKAERTERVRRVALAAGFGDILDSILADEATCTRAFGSDQDCQAFLELRHPAFRRARLERSLRTAGVPLDDDAEIVRCHVATGQPSHDGTVRAILETDWLCRHTRILDDPDFTTANMWQLSSEPARRRAMSSWFAAPHHRGDCPPTPRRFLCA